MDDQTISIKVTINPDSIAYPRKLVEETLGAKCVHELQQAKPQHYHDTGFAHDCFVIHGMALAYWLHVHFNLNIFNEADAAKIVSVDQMAESITLRLKQRKVAYNIPKWCYLRTLDMPGDNRPARPLLIPSPDKREQPTTTSNNKE